MNLMRITKFSVKCFTLAYLCILSIGYEKQLDIYPWNGKYEERNQEILKNLKRNMRLDVYKETIPNTLLTSKFTHYRDASGRNFSVHIKGKDNVSHRKDRMIITDMKEFNKLFKGVCAVNLGPYWSYEWCFGSEIRQFHIHEELVMEEVNAQGTRKRYVDESKVGLRDPNWSLGKFSAQELQRTGSNPSDVSAPIESVTQYFRDGQYCDETGEGRKTTVKIMCCNVPDLSTSNSQTAQMAILLDVEETQTCFYSLTVCTPKLCPTGTAEQSLVETVKQLIASPCLTRQEEWWTYELCFNRSLIQYHAKLVPVVQGGAQVNLQQVVEVKFDLGFPPHDVLTNETALRQGVSRQDAWVDDYDNLNTPSSPSSSSSFSPVSTFFALARATGVAAGTLPGKSLLLEFSGGSPCDLLLNQTRSATIEVSCGVRDMITDITEDKTCHYFAKATSRVLCLSKIFAPKAREITQLQFNAIAPSRENLLTNMRSSRAQGKSSSTPPLE